MNSDTTFDNLIIYITFRQTPNNDIGEQIYNLYNWLDKNKHKKKNNTKQRHVENKQKLTTPKEHQAQEITNTRTEFEQKN